MKAIVAPINPGEAGPAVAGLHEALDHFGLTVSDPDRAKSQFGKRTQALVTRFQTQHDLPADGKVDERTADLLNRLLRERGLLDDGTPPPEPEPQPEPEPEPKPERPLNEIRGMVRDEDGRGIADLEVAVFERFLRDDVEIARIKTFRNGFYELQYAAPLSGARPKRSFALVVKVHREGEVWLTSKLLVDPRPLEWVNFMAGGGEYAGDSAWEKLIDTLAPHLGKVAMDELAETEERREVTFLRRRTKLTAQEVMLAVMAHRLARKTELSPEAFYALFAQRLPKNLPDSLVARTFEWTLIDQLDDSLLRGILATNEAALKQAFNRAIETNVVPLGFRKQIGRTLSRLAALAVDRTLDKPNFIGKAPLRSLLGMTRLDEAHHPEVARLMGANGGPTPRFWKALESQSAKLGISQDQLADARQTLQLGVVVKNHLPMLRTLKTAIDQGAVSGPTAFARLTEEEWRRVIRRSAMDGESGFPSNLDGETESDRIDTYARILVSRFERAFPTQALAGQVERVETVKLAHKAAVVDILNRAPDLDLRRTSLSEFAQANPRILANVNAADRGAVMADLGAVQRSLQIAPTAGAARVLLEKNLHSSQRIYAMGRSRVLKELAGAGVPLSDARKTYANAELKYAVLLARLSEYSLDFNRVMPAAILAPVTPDLIAAKKIDDDHPNLRALFGSLDYCGCEHCRSVYGPAAYFVDLLVYLKERRAVSGTAKDVLFARRPDLGDIDLNCANTNIPLPYIDLVCEVLEDAVEPPPVFNLPMANAAQLVDGPIDPILLGALGGLGLALTPEARVEPIRPIKAADPATSWIIDDLSGRYRVRTAAAGFQVKLSRQTRGSAAELKAHPEYVNAAAYDQKLKTARHPHSLPFDLWNEEARTYLGQIGLKRHELMEALQKRAPAPAQPGDAAIAAEYFGIGDEERKIIAVADAANQPLFWGVADPVTELATVSAMLRQAGFLAETGEEYRRLEQLLACAWVNPADDRSVIEEGDEPCNTDQQTITRLGDAKLDRANRFLRLWRRTGLEMHELDRLVRAPSVGGGLLDEACLVRLHRFRALQARLKLSAEELLALLEPIDIAPLVVGGDEESPSQYARLFLSRTVINPIDPAFEAGRVTDPATTEKISGHVAPILAALNITEADLDRLAAFVPDSLKLDGLSFVYRHALLARALKLSVKDLLFLMSLGGAPAAAFDLDRLRAFIETYDEMREARLTPAGLEYMLTEGAASPIGLSAGAVDRHLETMRTNIVRARDSVDAAGSTLEEVVSRSLSSLPAFQDPKILADALDVIAGRWTGTAAERDAFIDLRFVELADTVDAKARLGPLVGAGVAAREAEVAERFAYVRDLFYRLFADRAIVESVANLFRVEPRMARSALDLIRRGAANLGALFHEPALIARNEDGGFTHGPADPALADARAGLLHLHKALYVAATLRLSGDAFDWFLAHPADYGRQAGAAVVPGLDFDLLPVSPGDAALPLEALLNLAAVRQLSEAYPAAEDRSLPLVLEDLSSQNAAFDRLAAWMGWERAELDALHAALGLAFPGDYRLQETYRRLLRCREQARKAGVRIALLSGWAKPLLSRADSDSIKQAVKARYEGAQWLSVSATLQDRIRERKRSALVDFLIANPPDRVAGDPSKGKAWDDVNGLYAHMLIDVEMSPCQLTSRIKQACASVQLCVQRFFLGLEKPEVVVDTEMLDGDDTFYDEDWLQWEWMKNYRVWEANRKVFLYPENWIEPELRDDNSPFFEELRTELQQSAITDPYAEEVYLNFLRKLDDVARLDVVGAFHHHEGPINRLHVVARTKGTPYVYYHREWVNEAAWTPWKKIEIDIQGEHIIPVVYNRRLHIFWPIFTQKPEAQQPVPAAQTSASPPSEPKTYLEIQLAWTIYKNGKWTPRKVSQARLIHPWPRPSHSYSFKANEDFRNILYIDVYTGTSREFNDAKVADSNGNPTGPFKYPQFERHNETAQPWHSSAFVFNGDVAEVRLVDINGWYNHVHTNYGEPGRAIKPLAGSLPSRRLPTGLHYLNNQLTHNVDAPADDLNIVVLDASTRNGERVLSDVPTPFSVTILSTAEFLLPYGLFFYQDKSRTYYAYAHATYRRDYTASSTVYVTDAFHHRFYDFHHPYSTMFIRELNMFGLKGLLNRKVQLKPETISPGNGFSFDVVYHPNKPFVSAENPTEIVDFSFGSAYGLYNWELFFHAPLYIACRCIDDRRYAQAIKWLGYIFDPTSASKEDAPQKYWITKPFYNHNQEDYREQRIDNVLKGVNANIQKYVEQVEAWRDNPFKPHLIARLRNVAYQWAVVMKYLDALIGWGDDLFRRDTIESVNEATQLYILAAEILGPRPILVPERHRGPDKSFDDVEKDLDAFGNLLEEVENGIAATAGGGAPPEPAEGSVGEPAPKLPRLFTFYFCLPPNEMLLGYWKTVADRLFKVRHCMNIEGVVRQLPLFEPPIDPALLVRAAAAGLEIGSILNQLSAPLPHHRFAVMLQRAADFTAELRALGASFVSAIERRDVEAIALLRSGHEIKLFEAMLQVREEQIREAEESVSALRRTKEMAEERRNFYRDARRVLPEEALQQTRMREANVEHLTAASISSDAAFVGHFPMVSFGIAGAGGSPTASTSLGGATLASVLQSIASTHTHDALKKDYEANAAGMQAVHERRWQDFKREEKVAGKEILQIERQTEAAEIRRRIAEKERDNLKLQIDNAKEMDEAMRDKFSSRQLYDWMVSQLSGVYFKAYGLAYDMCKRAERCYQYETAQFDASYIAFDAWDGLKRGLLAGERLAHDLRRLETAYLAQRRREYELTKHISLADIEPGELIRLKETGACDIRLPEWLFDLDYPGHYQRRIASVTLTIPCVTGPYTGVHATLTLLSNKVRTDALVGADYEEADGGADPRFRYDVAAIQSIATSHAQDDGGLFELSFRDDRYLPFEGAGALSAWRLELPIKTNRFDLASISDVVMQLRYTACEGGELLREKAGEAADKILPKSGVQLLNLRSDFATEWHRFLHPAGAADQILAFEIDRRHLPFYARGKGVTITAVELFARGAFAGDYQAALSLPLNPAALLAVKKDAAFGPLHHVSHPAAPPGGGAPAPLGIDPFGTWTLKIKRDAAPDFRSLSAEEIADMVLILHFETDS